ncbi:hypothetical protein HZS_1574 [Henneguya salminicola]|nr:hypothetical protein HZS_1574 [Henneguya salminicola]
MFYIAQLKSLVEVKPHQFEEDELEIIKSDISRRFCDKILFKVGLFLSTYNINKVAQPFILPGCGSYHAEVYFSAVVFCPFVGQVVEGRIKSINSSYVQISLKFFEDIYLHPDQMQQPSRFDTSHNAWVWNCQTEQDQSHQFFILEGEKIRFRVTEILFKDVNFNKFNNSNQNKPMTITVTINEPGLGPTLWWPST